MIKTEWCVVIRGYTDSVGALQTVCSSYREDVVITNSVSLGTSDRM